MLLILAALTVFAGGTQAQRPNVKSTEIVRMDGADYYLHKVERGETLSSISRLYDVPVRYIERDNPSLSDGLKAGQTIRVECRDIPHQNLSPRRMARRFEEHTVARGETAYSIARAYSISINVLVEDNPGLDPAKLGTGQKLMIRKSEIGESSPQETLAEIRGIADALTEVSGAYIYYVVDIGETIYSISRKFGVEESDITDNNDLSGGLRAGAIIRIPTSEVLLKAVFADDKPQGEYTEDGSGAILRSGYDRLRLAMLLPLSSGHDAAGNSNFAEFYQGALLALEDLKHEGHSLDADLYDTQRSPERTAVIAAGDNLRSADLIIGPVYEECLGPVVDMARERGIPVVSPLAAVEGAYGGLLYQLTPAPEYRYDKLKGMFTPEKNIVFITTEFNDTELESRMNEIAAGVPFRRVVYNKGMSAEQIDGLIDSRRENLFVVLSADESGVDLVLAALSSVQNNRLARTIRTGAISVIGNSRWMRYANLDRNLLFKLNVSFVANYHADRSSAVVAAFDRRYIVAFGQFPSLYSYRGYDAVKLFAGAMLSGEGSLNERLARASTPLQSGYDFAAVPSAGNNINTEWALVTYRNNYTVTVQ